MMPYSIQCNISCSGSNLGTRQPLKLAALPYNQSGTVPDSSRLACMLDKL